MEKESDNITALVPLTKDQAIIIQLSLLETMMNLSRDGKHIVSQSVKKEFDEEVAEIGGIVKILADRFGELR